MGFKASEMTANIKKKMIVKIPNTFVFYRFRARLLYIFLSGFVLAFRGITKIHVYEILLKKIFPYFEITKIDV